MALRSWPWDLVLEILALVLRSWSWDRSHPVGLLLSWWKFDLSLTYVRQRPLGQVNCETVISDHTSACTIDTFFLQSVTSVMGSLGKSSQNVGVQSYFYAISATNNDDTQSRNRGLTQALTTNRWGSHRYKYWPNLCRFTHIESTVSNCRHTWTASWALYILRVEPLC